MKVIRTVFLVVLLAPATVSAEQYGGRIVRCLAEHKVTPDAPEFNQKADQCDRKLKMDDAKFAWQVCVAHAVKELDDRMSPASDIATAVSDQCGDEYQALLDASTISPETKYRLHSQRAATTKDLAVKLVLMQRAEANRQARPILPTNPR